MDIELDDVTLSSQTMAYAEVVELSVNKLELGWPLSILHVSERDGWRSTRCRGGDSGRRSVRITSY